MEYVRVSIDLLKCFLILKLIFIFVFVSFNSLHNISEFDKPGGGGTTGKGDSMFWDDKAQADMFRRDSNRPVRRRSGDMRASGHAQEHLNSEPSRRGQARSLSSE